MPDGFDTRAFRDAAGQFMTGVTIVTTLDADGGPAGITANSFTTVSLHPPLLLFCLGGDSSSFDAFDAGNPFVVHVLAADQRDLAVRFAAKGIDRFADVDWRPGLDGVPIIEGCLSLFQCVRASAYEGGDHVILLGEVRDIEERPDGRPALGYFRGRYVESG